MPHCEADVEVYVCLSTRLLPVKLLQVDLFPPDEENELYFRFLVPPISNIALLAVILMYVERVPISLFSASFRLAVGIR